MTSSFRAANQSSDTSVIVYIVFLFYDFFPAFIFKLKTSYAADVSRDKFKLQLHVS